MSSARDMRLDFLIFTVGGVRYGVDAAQIAGIDVYNGELADDLFWFHRELEYPENEVTYQAPMVVTVRTGTSLAYRVVIDSMEDIAEFSQHEINLFPALLEPLVMQKGLWGILAGNDAIILLIDFQLLLKHKHS